LADIEFNTFDFFDGVGGSVVMQDAIAVLPLVPCNFPCFPGEC
jgi:hypothetical protein